MKGWGEGRGGRLGGGKGVISTVGSAPAPALPGEFKVQVGGRGAGGIGRGGG